MAATSAGWDGRNTRFGAIFYRRSTLDPSGTLSRPRICTADISKRTLQQSYGGPVRGA